MLFKLKCFRFCENWKKIIVPVDKLEMSFSRSSGPGGQNVNKLNTKVEIRFHVPSCYWITEEVKKQLFELYPNKINNEGFFLITSQEHRTQDQNKKEAIKKLQEIIDIASVPKKERVIKPIVESVEEEEKRIKEKKRRSETKRFRNNIKDDNYRL
jgi:protein subunit release factor B